LVSFLLNFKKIKRSVFWTVTVYVHAKTCRPNGVQSKHPRRVTQMSYSCRLFGLLPKRLLDLNLSVSFKQRVFVQHGYIADVMQSIKELMM